MAPGCVTARGSTDRTAAYPPLMARTIAWMRRHLHLPAYDSHLPAYDPSPLAHLGISRATLLSLCQRHLGQSAGARRRRLRMELAESLLKDGDDSEAAIARRCGNGDVHCFRQAFARARGMRPARFRELVC